MITQTRWVDRKFNFDFPIGCFPCILERVRGTPARLEELITAVPGELLTKSCEGQWSIQEHCGHLFDLDELHDGRIDDFLRGAEVLRTADMTNKRTTEANYNHTAIKSILEKFRAARTAFANRLQGLDDQAHRTTALHPRLQQPMRIVDLTLFVAEHDDHHLARIRTIAAGR